MRYWGLFIAKLAAVFGVAAALKWLIRAVVPIGYTATRFGHAPFSHDLAYTTAMMVYTLICIGLLALVVIDQKYRCRTCARRLRMPVNSGSWSAATIFAPPRTEFICPYGHGTMTQPDLQIAGRETAVWVEHKDIWEELESLGPKR